MEAHSQSIRQQAYERWQRKEAGSTISQELGVDYDTVLDWIVRFKTEGVEGLKTRYKNSGRRLDETDPVYLSALDMRRTHSDWGAEYIRMHLVKLYPDKRIVHANQLRTWFKRAGLMAQKTHLPKPKGSWVSTPLQRVQVDAKEQLKTQDGAACCYLNFIDEHSGSALEAFVFPL